jgi:anaerobic selenocysteine-containing dehydrogenase
MRETRDSVVDIWGERRPYAGEGQWPERIDEAVTEPPERWVQSACVLCSNGCGLDIGVSRGRIVGVRGRGIDPVNRGRLGPKGLHGWRANESPERLTRPLIRRNGQLESATWDEAMALIVERSKDLINRFSGSSIGFYTSGQLMLEEYYTLGVIGKAGIGTPHMDGNTRLCTATAAAALKETFGSDGQPGSYFDVDVTDCILHVGHNIAETDTVLHTRVLDRLAGPNPPTVICIDPRETLTARHSTLHLAPKPGTNVAVLNGLINLVIRAGAIDREFIARHTIGFEELRKTVSGYTPEKVEQISDVPAHKLLEAGRILAGAPTLLSTVLQGVYQSMQGTAAAVQVNNLNLIRGMIGRPGCGILQMNGQPTAQNTRECGADGDLPAFRNWDNQTHIQELARLWNVEAAVIPHWAPPTHALQIFRYAEMLSIRMLWIQATNPAVTLPHLDRIRDILENPELFVVVQDAFLTETAACADVVLPAALWGEKTGTFTNVDRTVHISHKAVEPPGEARADFDIILDYARRMDFRDKDHQPLIKWTSPEEAFEAWKLCTAGRPCDYTGLSYTKLTGGPGIPWPCNVESPEGTPRIYTDFKFPTAFDACETFGHDLTTGAAITPESYRATDPKGRAFLKAVHYQPPHEQPDGDYPLWLTTGRVVHHFHTRSKTGRSPALQQAAPDAFAQMNAHDARSRGIADGDWVRLESRRGYIDVRARLGGIGTGQVFVPFHYGYWDDPERRRAANELTLFEWDAVSKQPHYKYAAINVQRIDRPSATQPDSSDGHKPPSPVQRVLKAVATSVQPARRHVREYLGLFEGSEMALADALEAVAEAHSPEPDIYNECRMLAGWNRAELQNLRMIIELYGEAQESEPDRLRRAVSPKLRNTALGLVRDLHDCWILVQETRMSLIVLDQAAKALRDGEMQALVERVMQHNDRQAAWLQTRIKQAAPQALVVPS